LIHGPGEVDPRLRAIDLGRWTGLAPTEVVPADLGKWIADPDVRPHGGESITDFVARLSDWLGERKPDDMTAVVAGGTAQGIVAAAIGVRFWSVEVAPADVVDLRRRAGHWYLRLGQQNR
jgi:broad specificity phosphatase PhoE